MPILTTGGDQLAELIDARQARVAIDYEDVDGWVAAIEKVSRQPRFQENVCSQFKRIGEEFYLVEIGAATEKISVGRLITLPLSKRVTMPSIVERAHAVYSRGGKELVLKRIKELSKDLLK